MRHLAIILPLFATLAAAGAQTPAQAASTPREAAIEKILSERESIAKLESAIVEARKAGVADQALLEARFLYHVDRRDDAAITAMLPEILKQRDAFKIEDTAIFSTEDDWLAVVEYVQAVAALGRGEMAIFKRHITEAFWLSPGQAAAFAPHIERARLEDAMRSVSIDFAIKPAPLAPGETAALGTLIEGRKAMLLHFCSPWSRECVAALPDFITTAGLLSANGIAVVSVLPADTPALLADARAMIHPHSAKPTGAWVIDPAPGSLARQLRVRNLPTMVIVSTEGKVLFNGDPIDARFWETLRRIDARIMRPGSGDGGSP
ncbi:MAG: hypothetical protein Q8Q59_14315 [Luteolibacter sp.]|jgi:hypothetical protein|nr:hypothetical protein [Luteolibacter sp.]